MSDRALSWALEITRTYWADHGATALFVLAREADDDGVVPVQDMSRLEANYGIKPGWLEGGAVLLEEDGLVEAGLIRPRDVETLHLWGARLRLDRRYPRDTAS
jgi:hypothetical protein